MAWRKQHTHKDVNMSLTMILIQINISLYIIATTTTMLCHYIFTWPPSWYDEKCCHLVWSEHWRRSQPSDQPKAGSWRHHQPQLLPNDTGDDKNDQNDKIDKVNRCLARYSPRATTTNPPTNRALSKPAWPGPNWPKMPILGQIWSFWGKKS